MPSLPAPSWLRPACEHPISNPQIRLNTKDLADQPRLPFGNEFLRWMLSDGAGALLITPTPRPDGPSLRIDWIDIASYATESDVCMYFGLQKHADGRTSSYRTVDSEVDMFRGGYLSLSQDIRVLKERLPKLMRAAFGRLLERHNLAAADLDWILPTIHLSGSASPSTMG